MRLRKRLNIGLYWLWGLFVLASNSWGEVTLTSIKKGGEGGKSWAILTFNDHVPWIGVSQSNTNKLTLYFRGNAGDLNNSTLSIEPSLNRSIVIRQVSRNPLVFRAEIFYDENIPLAVLKNNENIVVALNDKKFLNGQSSTYYKGASTSPGSLVNVAPEVQGNQVMTSFDFDGSYDLCGYIRPSNNMAALLFRGGTIGVPDTDFSFDVGSLKRVRFFPEEGGGLGFKAVMSFETVSSFNLIHNPSSLIVQTSYRGETGEQEVIRTEEAAAVPEVIISEEKVEEESEGMSLNDIVREIEGEMQDIDGQRTEAPVEATVDNNGVNLDLPPVQDETVAEDNLSQFIAAEKQEEDRPKEVGQIVTDQTGIEEIVESQTGESQAVESQTGESRPIVSRPIVRETISEPQVQEVQEEPFIPWDEEVSFQFINQPIVNVLRLIAGANELNMVIDEGVEGSITMDLKRVTLRRALERILHTHNCEYIVDYDIITVKPVRTVYTGGIITKVYRLKYADAENVAKVIKQVVSGDSLVQVFHPEFLSYTEAGKNRMDKNKVAIQGIRRSSTLVVTDRPEKIREVDRVIRELDRPPVQIIIESKLIELAPVNSNELGINWDKTINTMLWGQKILPGGDELDYSFLNETPDQNGQWKMANLSAGKYEAVLDFLKEQTDSKLKSNPRLLAMDNEESSISVGTTVPVPRIQRGLGGQGDMVTFEYKEVNIQLNVTPHVSNNEEITMYVNPVIEEITGWVEYLQHRAPITDKRAVNSIVSVKNGDTVVIGGLIKSQRIKTTSKVWLLGSIPLIGKLFQHEKYEDKQTDLMIFITPTIVR